MKNLMIKHLSVDPAGNEHEFFSYEPRSFVLFGQRKGESWISLASSESFQGIESAKSTKETQFRGKWSFAIAEAVVA